VLSRLKSLIATGKSKRSPWILCLGSWIRL
jgi:hypothetical protein